MSSSTNQVSNSSSKILKSNKIEKIIFGGSGITRDNGCVVFVPFSAPGDEVSLNIKQEKKNYKIAEIAKLHTPGKDRVTPQCPHYEKCGGCQLQHLSYNTQLEAKQSFVAEATENHPIKMVPAPDPWLYRSHIRLNLRKAGTGFHYGFIGADNRSLVQIKTCPLFLDDPTFFSQLRSYLSNLSNQGVKSASCRLFKTPQQIIIAFSFFPHLPKNLTPFPLAQGTLFKSPRKMVHFGETQIKTEILGLPISFSPYGFMQNNLAVSEKLYQTVIDTIGLQPKKVLDLYCGVGALATLLSRKGHQVIGVESNKEALKNGKDAHFICDSVENTLPKLLDTFKPDIILVNPPRTGLSKEVRQALNAPEILYTSCMPSTLKRDLQDLSLRYTLKEVTAFDMFPQTTHVETLAHLSLH